MNSSSISPKSRRFRKPLPLVFSACVLLTVNWLVVDIILLSSAAAPPSILPSASLSPSPSPPPPPPYRILVSEPNSDHPLDRLFTFRTGRRSRSATIKSIEEIQGDLGDISRKFLSKSDVNFHLTLADAGEGGSDFLLSIPREQGHTSSRLGNSSLAASTAASGRTTDGGTHRDLLAPTFSGSHGIRPSTNIGRIPEGSINPGRATGPFLPPLSQQLPLTAGALGPGAATEMAARPPAKPTKTAPAAPPSHRFAKAKAQRSLSPPDSPKRTLSGAFLAPRPLCFFKLQ